MIDAIELKNKSTFLVLLIALQTQSRGGCIPKVSNMALISKS